jgi:hypothetical protein
MTYYDVIRSSLRLIGVLAPGRGPNNSEITDAMFVLNSMLDSWTTEHLMIYTIERGQFPLNGQSSLTFGPGGTFAVRPLRIDRAAVVYSDVETPVPVLTRQRWTLGGGPTNVGGYEGVYNDNGMPLATVHVRPVPTYASDLVLYTWRALRQVIDENATVEFPPGYGDAIRYNLAVRCGPEWSRQPRPEVFQMAIDAKASVKSFNMQPMEMDASDGGALGCCGGGYDIYSDGY